MVIASLAIHLKRDTLFGNENISQTKEMTKFPILGSMPLCVQDKKVLTP